MKFSPPWRLEVSAVIRLDLYLPYITSRHIDYLTDIIYSFFTESLVLGKLLGHRREETEICSQTIYE